MRVISCVPSWTETLIECGVDVVGRTRFCVHPRDRARAIATVGGTKDIDWSKAIALDSDLFVFDREENPKAFADECTQPYVATHVRSVRDVAANVRELARALNNAELEAVARRWDAIAGAKAKLPLNKKTLETLPGAVDWICAPADAGLRDEFRVTYVIWKDPWMAAAPQTFIGSVLELVGLQGKLAPFERSYPTLDFGSLDPARDVLLFSTEPFPFLKKRSELTSLRVTSAIVNGESFSWFGSRSLRFLEGLFGAPPA